MPDAAAHIGQTLERVFTHIQCARMEGLPIVNARLRVESVGMQIWDGACLGILITPWCMNLLILPLPDGGNKLQCPIGSVQTWQLPSGAYPFLGAHLQELGHYLSCSLFSPMEEFETHADAAKTARTALDIILTLETSAQKPESTAPDSVMDRKIVPTRRSFLFGRPSR